MSTLLKKWADIFWSAWSVLNEDRKKFPSEAVEFLRQKLFLWYSIELKYEKSSDLPKIIEFDPNEMDYIITTRRANFPTSDRLAKKYGGPHGGPVVGLMGGPWDALKKYWFGHRLLRSLRERYQRGVKWQDTEYYQYLKHKSKKSKKYDEIDERVSDIDKLYNSIKTDGYISQSDLIQSNCDELSSVSPSTSRICGEEYARECRIGIGRDGELIRINEGKHRVTIAKILNVEKVPGILIVRHSQWQEVREAYEKADSREDIPTEYRKHWNHPDLVDVQPDCD